MNVLSSSSSDIHESSPVALSDKSLQDVVSAEKECHGGHDYNVNIELRGTSTCCGASDWMDNRLVAFLAVLLVVQFGSAASEEEAATGGLSLSAVYCSIALLLLTIYLYRCTFRCFGGVVLRESILLRYAPEMLLQVASCLLLFDQVVPAWVVLLRGLFCLAAVVVAANVFILYDILQAKKDCQCDNQEDESDPEAGDGGIRCGRVKLV